MDPSADLDSALSADSLVKSAQKPADDRTEQEAHSDSQDRHERTHEAINDDEQRTGLYCRVSTSE